jgi:hypothetical protein
MAKVEWWWYFAVLGGLVAVSAIMHVLVKSVAPDGSRGRVYGLAMLFIGADNRTSTSKLQATLWTYAVLWALISLLVGLDVDAFSEALGKDLREEYLLLLGGPYAAAIAAKAITVGKTTGDAAAKPPKTPSPEKSTLKDRLVEVVANDHGDVDLGDFQYFAFTLLALGFFVVAFVDSPTNGLPAIPGTLLVLSGVSLATYVGKKALPDGRAAAPQAPSPEPGTKDEQS